MEFEDLERELDERISLQNCQIRGISINSSSSLSNLSYQKINSGDQQYSPLIQIKLDDSISKTPFIQQTHVINQPEERLHLYDSISSNPIISLLQKFWRGPIVIRDKPPRPPNRLFLLENFPSKIRSRIGTSKYNLVVFVYLIFWFGLIYALLYPTFKNITRSKEGIEVISLSCTGDGYFWSGKNAECGVDGSLCVNEIFDSEEEELKDIYIKCPALCDKGWTYSSTPVGDQMVKYRQFVIGGGTNENSKKGSEYDLTYPYRGDSFPCAAAVHGGVLSPFLGGCVRISFSKRSGILFKSQNGKYETGFSIPFDSFFPIAYMFKHITNGEVIGPCYDLRLVVLSLNIILGFPLTYMSSGLLFYWVNTIVGFWTIILTLDPPLTISAADQGSVSALVSLGFERILPLLFVLYVVWHTTVKTTLDEQDGEGTSVLARCIFWYPLYWVGVANNITFDRLAIDRLTPYDIKEQPGAIFTISIVTIMLLLGIILQGFAVWKADKHRHYIRLYGAVIATLFCLALLPGLELRVHHYILGMLLVLGTSTKGITAFLLQGVLVGLLISGVARWDFASVVETHLSLMRGEAGANSKPPTGLSFSEGVLSWDSPVLDLEISDMKGYSVLINDVEVYVGTNKSLSMESFLETENYLKDMLQIVLKDTDSVPLYVRVGRSSLETKERGDYTRAGTLMWPSGEWTTPSEGVS